MKRVLLLIVLFDLMMIPAAWFGAYWLRFDDIPVFFLQQAWHALPEVIIAQGIAFFAIGLYRILWRFASLHDLLKILKATALGCGLITLILFITQEISEIPRSILPTYAVLLAMLIGGARIVYRLLKDRRQRQDSSIEKKRLLIVGAGQAAESLVRDMLRSIHHPYQPVALVDDKQSKQGREIHGVRVIGRIDEIPSLVEKYNIEHIVLALPSASRKRIREIIALCEPLNITLNTLPSLQHIVTGRVGIELIRDISLEDLLGREPYRLDWEGIRQQITGKVILVSGAGGSIGSEVCRQIALLQPKAMIAVELCEYNLFRLEQELSQRFPALKLHTYLVDVRDRIGIDQVLTEHSVDMIFHAAAYKHVPMLESQVRAAVNNNILGTQQLAEAAVRHQVKQFILVSTDKAVNPENIMGASKRVAEMICQDLERQAEKTHFITVRFGNVLGSAGSVVPIFSEQIAKGGPVTVTHPEVTRFFMTIPEAAQLILQSVAIANGGEILVLDMGEPIKIQYLAAQMCRLAGKEPDREIKIEYTGLRPGEKLYEELFHQHEKLEPTSHDKILRAQSRVCDSVFLADVLKQMQLCCATGEIEKLRVLIYQLVPELKQSTKAQTKQVSIDCAAQEFS